MKRITELLREYKRIKEKLAHIYACSGSPLHPWATRDYLLEKCAKYEGKKEELDEEWRRLGIKTGSNDYRHMKQRFEYLIEDVRNDRNWSHY